MFDKNLDTIKTVKSIVGKPAGYVESYRILLVDDEISILKTLSLIFKNLGFETTVASNGFEALNKILRESFDILITDLNMKGLDGLSLIKKVKQISPLTPAILITGEDSVSVKKKTLNNKVDLIIFKPFKIGEIEEALFQVIENINERFSLQNGFTVIQ